MLTNSFCYEVKWALSDKRGMYKKRKENHKTNKIHQKTTNKKKKKNTQLTEKTSACWTIRKQISQEDEVQ